MVAMAITSQGTRPVIKGVVRLEEAALSDHAYTGHGGVVTAWHRDRWCECPPRWLHPSGIPASGGRFGLAALAAAPTRGG